MKIFPQNAFPLAIIAHEKKKKWALFGIILKHFSSEKKILRSSQTLFCLCVTEVLSGLCAGKVDRSWLWHEVVGQGKILSWSTVDLGNGVVTKSPSSWWKVMPFPQIKPVLAQKCKMGSAGHQNLILGYFHACSPPPFQTQPG